MTETRLVELSPQPTAVVREQVPMTALTQFFDRAFAAVMHTLAAQGVEPAGPPFGLYHGTPGETVDVEAGFPVKGSIEPDETVIPSVLPGGRAVEAVHIGPYDSLPDTYVEAQRRLSAEGLQPAGDMWECYLTDPGAEPDPADWRTLVVLPVA